MGDKVLKNIAAVLSTQSRKGDILARMGGEEFALAVPNTEIDGIRLLVQRIKDSVSTLHWENKDQTFGITLSIGISELKLTKDSHQSNLIRINEIVHNLVREADDALYHSKNIGRDAITFQRDLEND
jgi:diguanylate cyclase (GGDEF)-like protein